MSFDRLARHYRWMETVLAGATLQTARLAWLDAVRVPRTVLLVGEGPGRFLEKLLPVFPEATVHVVDASCGMLEVACRSVPPSERHRVRFEQARLPEWRGLGVPCDLLVTQFVLDCFDHAELPRVLSCLDAQAAGTADWLLADFALPESGWRRARAQVILDLMYAFFRRASGISAAELAAPEPGLVALGWQRVRRREWEWGLVRSSLWRRAPAG